MKKVFHRFVITTLVTLVSTLALLVSPVLTAHAYADISGMPIKGWVTRVNVSNLGNSVVWYLDKLGMERNREFDTPTWTQFYYPGQPKTQIGLYQSQTTVSGSGETIATIVVPSIEYSVYTLDKKGVKTNPICDAGKDVALTYFKDPDGNILGLRQEGGIPSGLPPC